MTEFRSELGIAPSPMGIYGIAVPDSYLHLFPHFSRGSLSRPLPRRQCLCLCRTGRQASGPKVGQWEWRQKSGVTLEWGPAPDRIDASRRKGPGQQVLAIVNFTQESQQNALPHQMWAPQSDVPTGTLELLSHGIRVLLNHDGESEHAPVIASTNHRHPVERIAE
jgi:hypothetical protein